jgi:hypothetical protein
MRRILVSGLIAFSATTTVSAQNTAPAPGEHAVLLSQDRRGGANAILGLQRTDFYLGAPSVSVPAEPLQDATLTASRFSIRTWTDGPQARVVVYAVTTATNTSRGEIETPIALHTLTDGESVRVRETERWGAAPVTIRLMRRLPR